MTQSRSNAVTQGAICTWVERLTPSDHAAIAGEHMRCNPHAHPRCARRRRCFSWHVDRNAPPGRRDNCCCAASAHQWAVASPVQREACARHCSRGARARASAPGRRVVLRRRGPRIDRQRPRPLARYRRHISHGRRQAKARRQARRQEAGRQEVRSRVEYATRPSLTGPRTGRPRRSRPPRRAPRSSMRRPDAISMLFP